MTVKSILATALLLFGTGLTTSAQVMENGLNERQRKIAVIAAHTATGNLDGLKTELAGGLDAGLTVNEIKEVLVQMYAYCGFPRSLQGINTFMAVLGERRADGIDDPAGPEASPVTDPRDKYSRGKENLQELTGIEEKAPSGANAFAPAIDVFLKEHLFADIFERDVLSFRERELATVSALAAMEGVDPMLRSHLNMARNTGWTQTQMDEAVSLAAGIGSESRNRIFARGNSGSVDWFTGQVYVEGLVSPDEMENLYSVGQVTFTPGARTNWHTHPIGQTLLVLEGRGWYQERGKTAQELVKGSVIAIPRDVEHWHGASAEAALVHIAISNVAGGNAVTWMTPVTEEEYTEVNR